MFAHLYNAASTIPVYTTVRQMETRDMSDTKITESELQEHCRRLVEREVRDCASTLIHDLALGEESEYFDEILSVCVQDDWESAARDDGWSYEGLRRVQPYDDRHVFYNGEGVRYVATYDGMAECWRELCEDQHLDPYPREALEHWIVSDWLAQALSERGEMVAEIHGLNIWGRCTSGRAIFLDGVIREIWRALNASR